jgi:hypothetical protein
MNKRGKIDFVFFGTPELAVYVLDELEKTGQTPTS